MDPNSGSGISQTSQEAQKFLTNGSSPLPSQEKSLPQSYGDNKLVIMVRDPLWFFSYWEITPDKFDQARNQVGEALWQKGQAILRVYDMTGREGDVSAANRFFDVGISIDTRQWYVNVSEPARSYLVDLGFVFPDGRFISLLRSNRIQLPAGAISSQTDSRWMMVDVQEWQKLLEGYDPRGRGGIDLSSMTAHRWEFFRSVYSGTTSRTGIPDSQSSKPQESKT
jgi:hypothetical protein